LPFFSLTTNTRSLVSPCEYTPAAVQLPADWQDISWTPA